MWKAGKTIDEIVNEFGVTREAVHEYASQHRDEFLARKKDVLVKNNE